MTTPPLKLECALSAAEDCEPLIIMCPFTHSDQASLVQSITSEKANTEHDVFCVESFASRTRSSVSRERQQATQWVNGDHTMSRQPGQ
jgi:hypothetical protein